MDSNQILHGSKHHQICDVGHPVMWKTDPRWRTTAILKNGKLQYFCNHLTDFNEILHGDGSGTSATHRPLRLTESEKPRWRLAAILKNQNISVSQ